MLILEPHLRRKWRQVLDECIRVKLLPGLVLMTGVMLRLISLKVEKTTPKIIGNKNISVRQAYGLLASLSNFKQETASFATHESHYD